MIAQQSTSQKHRWWILTAVGMFTIMSTLDGSIVNIALPVMAKDLRVPMNQAEWVVSIYLIVICALLLLMGKLGDRLGKVRVFKWGTALFTIGSLLAGFNNSFWLLLFARVVQAVGASMTMANNSGIITEVFPKEERGKALGMIGSFVSVGSIAGPGLGGLILGHLPWGYIFWINIPVGLLTMLLGHFVLPEDKPQGVAPTLDWLGFATFAGTIISFFLGIYLGQEIGFSQPLILGLFAAAAVGLGAFFWAELHQSQPLVAFSLFKNQEFTISLVAAVLIFVVNFFFNVLAPFYLQNARGLDPTHAGYLLMVFPVVQVIISPLSGSLADRIGPYTITLVGLSLIVLTQLGMATWGLDTSWTVVAAWVAVMGFGNAVFQSPNNTIVMSAVAPKDLGIAGGLNALARNMGMVIGIATATTTLFSTMSHEAGKSVTTYPADNPALFIHGMHKVYLLAAALAFVATALTAYRMLAIRRVTERANRKQKQRN